jgi:hypothetical protein
MRIQPQNGADWRHASLGDLRPDAGTLFSCPDLTVGLNDLVAGIDAAPILFLSAATLRAVPPPTPMVPPIRARSPFR